MKCQCGEAPVTIYFGIGRSEQEQRLTALRARRSIHLHRHGGRVHRVPLRRERLGHGYPMTLADVDGWTVADLRRLGAAAAAFSGLVTA